MNEALDEAMGHRVTALVRGAGVPDNDITDVIRQCLYSYTFNVLYVLDEPDGTLYEEPPETDVGPNDPRWLLMEVSPQGEVTGRDVGGLHASLLDADPTGSEGDGWL